MLLLLLHMRHGLLLLLLRLMGLIGRLVLSRRRGCRGCKRVVVRH